jgi:hypothetical protein
MNDPTETIRHTMVQDINADAGDREWLKEKHGQVWNTQQLQEDFDVLQFAAPLIVVRQRSTGQMGSMFFQHQPRFYWGFKPDR